MLGGWPVDVSSMPIPVIGLALAVVMLLGAGAGRALRLWQATRPAHTADESGESIAQEGYLLGGVMALLGLLLAFSFGMVLDRYETRRHLAIDEANAIGTAYLRSQFLDEPYRSRLSSLLVDYTSNLIKIGSGEGDRTARLAQDDRLLTEIWAALRAGRESALRHGMTTALQVTFNEVIDLDAERRIAWDLRLPPEVLALVFAYLIITSAVVGHQIDGPRGRRAALVLAALLALSVIVITDINRPIGGREPELQKPMLMLLQSLQGQPPKVFGGLEGVAAEAPE